MNETISIFTFIYSITHNGSWLILPWGATIIAQCYFFIIECVIVLCFTVDFMMTYSADSFHLKSIRTIIGSHLKWWILRHYSCVCFCSICEMNWQRFSITIRFKSWVAFSASQHQRRNWNEIATLSLQASTKIEFEVQIAVVHISPSHPFSNSYMKLYAVSYENNSENLHIHLMRFINIFKYVRERSARPICTEINPHDNQTYETHTFIHPQCAVCAKRENRCTSGPAFFSSSNNSRLFQLLVHCNETKSSWIFFFNSISRKKY